MIYTLLVTIGIIIISILWVIVLRVQIAERRKAQEALLDSENRFQSLSDAAFEGILITEKENILDANSTLAKMFTYKGRQVRVTAIRDLTEQKKAEEEIKTLIGILPICSFCKNIRNDEGYYQQIEEYIHEHSGVDFSHTVCPNCMKKHYPEEYKNIVLEEKD